MLFGGSVLVSRGCGLDLRPGEKPKMSDAGVDGDVGVCEVDNAPGSFTLRKSLSKDIVGRLSAFSSVAVSLYPFNRTSLCRRRSVSRAASVGR